MKKLLQTLTETFGPSGYEDEVRKIVRSEVESLADEIKVDALGNLIARTNATALPDEVLLDAIHAEKDIAGCSDRLFCEIIDDPRQP